MIDKNIITPMYQQIANELRGEILTKQYGDHGCIGTHNQLADRFSVSIRTIRAAVQLLEKEGLVEIHQGKGTFVRRPMLVDRLQDLTSISNILMTMGVETSVSVPVFELRATPLWLPKDVREGLGEKCIFTRRVVSVDGTPAADAAMYLPGRFFPLIRREEVEANTVYQIYQNKLGIELGMGEQIIRAAGASGDVAACLGLPENSPVLRLERKAYDSGEALIEYMILTYEASKYCFQVKLDLNKQR